jgi:dGTPase
MSAATGLARWAADPAHSRGRRIAEPPSPPRTEHQRDRDRIVHSNAFRRLVYKTQVFINHEGDLFRTRLTHSLEVAQLSRSVARQLSLNEDLVEAIALAHDLGHTPFGHAGQDALAECMAQHGGFEHNLQSLRVVDRLEARYAAFDGLNLSFETREGILKHCSRRNAERLLAEEPTGPALRFVQGGSPSLEAQLVNLCDELAYSAHDIDDGVRSGLIDTGQLREVPMFGRCWSAVSAAHPALDARRMLHETLRRMLSSWLGELASHTRSQLVAQGEDFDAVAVRHSPALVALPDAMRDALAELKRFLFRELYRHPQVTERTTLARQVVVDLFQVYRSTPQAMSPDYARPSQDPVRTVADYVAGMTDRFALREHERHTGRRLLAF